MTSPRILWYLNPLDGETPWQESGRIPPDYAHLREQAKTFDRLGYYGVLTTAPGALAFVADTERLRFLIPEYPGARPPALLAAEARTFDEYSGGRLIFNQVNGRDGILRHLGRNESHDERYAVSKEYWQAVKTLYSGHPSGYEGEHFSFGPRQGPLLRQGPRQAPYVPIWGSGQSDAGLKHAAEVLDVYLTFLNHPDELKRQIDTLQSHARDLGRDTVPVGVLASIIVRETEEEAWKVFEEQLARTDVDELVKNSEYGLTSYGHPPIDELTHPDPQRQARIDALRERRIPQREDLEFYPNLAAGLTIWSPVEAPFDIVGKGQSNYLVGSADNIAERIRELQSSLGIDTWILSGWPSQQEAEHTARLLFPRLNPDHPDPEVVPDDGSSHWYLDGDPVPADPVPAAAAS